MAIHFGASNGRFLVGSAFGGVDEYNSATGAYIKTYSPGGGWQWAGIYAPNGNVYIGSMSTNDVREYDVNTGAFVRVVCTVPGPADMRIGPNGNLYICSYTNSLVQQNDPATGNFINMWSQTAGDRTNDIAFLPNGEILVTVMSSNVFYRYSPALVLLGSYFGSGWLRPHGIDISPHDGNIYVVEDRGGGTDDDIWFAKDLNNDGDLTDPGEGIGRWASNGTVGSEFTGLYFDPTNKRRAWVNIQHPSSGNDRTIEITIP